MSKVWTIGWVRNCLDTHLGQIVCDKDGVVDWYIVLVEMPGVEEHSSGYLWSSGKLYAQESKGSSG